MTTSEQEFTAKFTALAVERARKWGLNHHAGWGNCIDLIPYSHGRVRWPAPDYDAGGNGCEAWQNWMLFAAAGSFRGVPFAPFHVWTTLVHPFRGVHKVVVARLPSRHLVLDPWRNPSRPVYHWHDYTKRFTHDGLHPGKAPLAFEGHGVMYNLLQTVFYNPA